MRTVLIFGTFDFLHIGHLHVLTEAKKLCDRLVVSVARDLVVEEIKGKKSIHNEDERRKIVESLSLVDEVLLGDEKLSTYEILERIKPSVIALGYDQSELKSDIEQFLQKTNQDIQIVVLDRYRDNERKSSMIKKVFQI
jgi:FAD synthetase